MSTVLQCENRRLTGTYSFSDELACGSPSPISSYSFYVDTPLESVVLCDRPDAGWNKMSVNSSGNKGKRKKTDNKPQSQLNKCLNEKRRRQQENIFIEELAELISVSFSDMNSLAVKPDKCAILQETVHQIRNIKQQQQQQQELQQQQQNQQNQSVVSTDDIQQGEVSSSKPTGLSNEIFGPLLLEALEGFAFLLNHEGKVDYVTDNVSQFIKFTKDEILGKSIYSIIHPNDHGKFSSCLLPTSISNRNQGGSGGGSSQQPKNRSFNCSMLMKSGDDFDESVADNKERDYEEVQISSTLVKGDSSSNGSGEVTSESLEMGPGLICVARRIPSTEKHLSAPFEQFSMKLDTRGKIIGIDTSGTSIYTSYIDKKLIGELVQSLCHHQDLQKLNIHLKNTLKNETDISSIFRFKLAPDKFISVQTKSRLFPTTESSPSSEDFIMTTYSIIEDREVCQMIESRLPHTQLNPSSSSHGSGPGGPYLNGLNGRPSTVTTPDNSNPLSMNSSTDYQSYPLAPDMYEPDFFPNNPYEIEDRPTWSDRPDSRHSLASVASPANPFSHTSPMTNPPSTPFTSALPFSPVDKDTKDGHQDSIVSDMKPNGDKGDRLRFLLTVSNSEKEQDANHRSIEDYRGTQQDESMEVGEAGPSPGQQRKSVTPTTPNSSSSSNLMLLSLLNKKPETENDFVSKMIMHSTNEEKHQNTMENDMHSHNQSRMLLTEAENGLMRDVNFPFNASSPTNGSNSTMRKRHSEDGDDGSIPSKRVPAPLESIPPPIPASNRSNLQEKNKMLASLLAKEPSTPPQTTVLPTSLIYATPQDRLSRVLSSITMSARGPSPAVGSASVQLPQPNQLRVVTPRQVTPNSINTSAPFLNDLLLGMHSPQQQLHQLHSQQIQRQIKMTNSTNSHGSNGNNNMMHYDAEVSIYDDDKQLHEILEYIVENSVNENLDSGEAGSNSSEITVVSSNVTANHLIDNSSNAEKVATINAITRSFMQVEQNTRINNRLPGLPQQVVLQQHQQLPMQQQQIQSPINQSSQQFQHPPPTYQQRPNRMPMHPNVARMPARPPVPQYPHASSNAQYQQSPKYLAREQKRLIQQQQQQEFSQVSNATVNSSSNTNLQNINLSAVPPPNVSLQPRTNNLPSESPNAQQLSPGGNAAFGSPLLPAPQISPSQRQQPAYSPLGTNHSQQSFQSLNGSFNGATTQHSPQPQGARLSPSGGIPSFQPQLSPRISQAQTSYATTVMTSQGAQQVQPQNAWPSPQHQPPPQSQQQQQVQQSQQQHQQQQQLVNSRLNMQQQQQQQQQNAMLEARLSGGGVYAANQRTATVAATAGMFTQQPQKSQQGQSPQMRGLTSPGARQSPFPADISPTTATSYNTVASQQYRMPRSMNVTSSAATMATAQVPGGNNCIRSYSNMGSLSLKDNSQNTSPNPPPFYTHQPMVCQHHGDTSPYGYLNQSLPVYDERSRLSHSSGPHNASNNNTNNSEYVRNSLRALVDSRQQSVPLQVQSNQPMDLESLGLSFEMPQHENDPQRWGNLSGDGSEGSPSTGLPGRPSLDDVMRSNIGGNPNSMNSMGSVSGGEKSSLLQKLLSE